MRRRPAAPARQTLRPGHSTFRFAQSFESVWHFLAAGQNSRDRACGTRWKNPGMNAPTSVAYRSASRAATRAAIGHAPRARHLIVNSNCYVSQLKMPERAVPPKAYTRSSRFLRVASAKGPLILSFSPRGEGTPELTPRIFRASSLPAASAYGCGHAEMQARQGELAGRETE